PSRLVVPVRLPAVTALEATAHGAEIRRGRDVLATISRPVAVAADGRRVEVELALTDSALELRVSHRAEDVAYPIIVDPVVNANLQAGGSDHEWAFEGTDNPWQGWTDSGGLTIYLQDYTTNSMGRWFAQPPGDAYVTRLDS